MKVELGVIGEKLDYWRHEPGGRSRIPEFLKTDISRELTPVHWVKEILRKCLTPRINVFEAQDSDIFPFDLTEWVGYYDQIEKIFGWKKEFAIENNLDKIIPGGVIGNSWLYDEWLFRNGWTTVPANPKLKRNDLRFIKSIKGFVPIAKILIEDIARARNNSPNKPVPAPRRFLGRRR